MTRKCHNYKLQTNIWHHKEETQNRFIHNTINPLYTNGFFLLVWYNNLGTVQCTYMYLGVLRLYFSKNIVFFCLKIFFTFTNTGPHSAVGNVSGYRCKSDCRYRGYEFDPDPVPLSVTSESMCTKYWLTACSSMPRKKVWLLELTVPSWP